MDRFFRSLLEIKWNIGTQTVTFLDGLLALAITGSGLVMRLVLMGGFNGWYGLMDYAAAVLAAILVFKGTGNLTKTIGAYSVFLILPTVLVAGSYWQKPDMCYVVLTLGAFACIAWKKESLGAVLYGLALLMNIQAVFLLPVFVILWMYRRIRGISLTMPVLALGVRLIRGENLEYLLFGNGNPAAAGRVLDGIANGIRSWELSGGNPEAVATAKQAVSGNPVMPLSDYWPNVYPFFGEWDFLTEYAKGGILFAAAIVLVLFTWFFLRANDKKEAAGVSESFSMEFMLELCVFFAILMPFFLPHMNARSGLLAEVFAVLLAFYNVRKAYIALVHLVLSFSMYQICLTGIARFPLAAYSAVMLGLLFCVGVHVYKDVHRIWDAGLEEQTKATASGKADVRSWLKKQMQIGRLSFTGWQLVYVLGMTLLGIFIRTVFLPYISQDYTGYWQLWFEEIHKYGGMKALAYEFYDYSPLFMYFLVFIEGLPFDPMYTYKIVMSVLDVAAACACALLVKELTNSKDKAVITYGIVFLLPTVIANSSLWCQCDVIYTTLILLCLYYFMKDQPAKAMVFYSLSFCLKLQTLFVFPALIILWVYKKVRVEHFLMIPVSYVLSILPAWAAGRPFKDLLLVYFAQGYTDTWALTLSWPNIYEIITPQALLQVYSTMGKCLIITILMCTMYYMAKKNYCMTREVMLEMFLFYGMLTVYFLPFMHERYGYLVDILAVAYAMMNQKRFFVPVLHVLISYVSYTSFLTKGKALPMVVYAFLLLGLLVTVGVDLYRRMQVLPEGSREA